MRVVFATALVLAVSAPAFAGQLNVVGMEPAARVISAPADTAVTIHFSAPVNPATVQLGQSLSVCGRWSGAATGPLSFSNNDQSVTLTPAQPFSAGEAVMVVLSHDIQAADTSPLRSAGYSFQFWVNGRLSPRVFSLLDVLSTRTTPAEGTRAYGGIASDVNNDGFLDLTIVNEDTADLRVFLNQADRTGLYQDFLQPTFPVNDRASPSEPADFNRDGIVDICVANINTGSVSVLLGVGDGTFGPQQQITVGTAPRGIAVLDADGDGDVDIANTNFSSGNVSLLLNDGNGVFGPPTFFEGGGGGEWGLCAADMTNDGILDLVVGARSPAPGRIIVNRGNGDGTFTPLTPQSSGGTVWMLVCGDVNGNGTEDVAVANSGTNRGVILLGDGAGNLAPPVNYDGEAFPIASDLGDLDGDGDLDWILANYSGDFSIYINNGAGQFTRVQQIPPAISASCSIMLDIDNDGDLDLCLIDEEADELQLFKNSGTAPFPGDADDDCHVALDDHASFLACMTGPTACAVVPCYVFDFDDDCDVDGIDFRSFAGAFTGTGQSIGGCVP